MIRKKLTLAYISNDSERKASYKKRKKGLIKKISELSTLCGVDACAIIYSQYDPEPEVWPSHMEAQAIIARFRKFSEMDQSRKMVNLESLTRQRIKKAAEHHRRLQKENKYCQLECYMYQCIAGNRTLDDTHLPDATNMYSVINQTLHNIQAKQNAMMAESPYRRQTQVHPLSVEVPPLPQLPPLAPPLPQVLSPDDVMLPMEEVNLDSFPWNLVPSPTEGDAAGLEDGDFGWDSRMGQPYPYIFNPSASNQQGSDQGNSSNFSNNFNYFNYFNN